MKILAAPLLALLALGCSGGAQGQADPAREDAAHTAYLAGNKAFESGDFAEAVERYSEAAGLSPRFPQALARRGRAREHLGRLAEAETDYSAAIEAAGEDRRAIYHYHRGACAMRQERPAPAVEDFTRALELLEQWPDLELAAHVRAQRGAAYAELGRAREAAGDFDFVLARTHDPALRRQVEALRARPKGAR